MVVVVVVVVVVAVVEVDELLLGVEELVSDAGALVELLVEVLVGAEVVVVGIPSNGFWDTL